LKCFCNVLAFL